MTRLYNDDTYGPHLARQGNVQHIMLGFSDGTKDGGYLMANWSIFRAKEEITPGIARTWHPGGFL